MQATITPPAAPQSAERATIRRLLAAIARRERDVRYFTDRGMRLTARQFANDLESLRAALALHSPELVAAVAAEPGPEPAPTRCGKCGDRLDGEARLRGWSECRACLSQRSGE